MTDNHKTFAASLPCIITLRDDSVAHQIGGRGYVPLTPIAIAKISHMGENAFWDVAEIDPYIISKYLTDNTGDYAACETYIKAAFTGYDGAIQKLGLDFLK